MEKTTNMKAIGAASMAVMLAGAGAAIVTAAPEALAAQTDEALVAEQAQAGAETVAERTVEGHFAFTQDAVSANAIIRDMFTKASAVLCSSMPEYNFAVENGEAVVTGPDGSVLGTVEELAESEEGQVLIGCACASNVAGGGAIVNAGVSGTTLAALVAALGA